MIVFRAGIAVIAGITVVYVTAAGIGVTNVICAIVAVVAIERCAGNTIAGSGVTSFRAIADIPVIAILPIAGIIGIDDTFSIF